jgi:hypothetical protein
MSDTVQITSLVDFLTEMLTYMGKCQCGNAKCKSMIFLAKGNSGFEYIVDYDPAATEHSNIAIVTRKKEDVVFNGRCENEHDIAQVLRMVVI